MRLQQIGIVFACAFVAASVALAQEPTRAREAAVTVVACPAIAGQALLAVDLGEPAGHDMPLSAIAETGTERLNTFAGARVRGDDFVGCAIQTHGKVIAYDVATKIPRSTCETTPSLLATDLALIEVSAPLSQLHEGLVVLSGENFFGSVVATAGRTVLVNVTGVASEKSYRSQVAEPLTARVRNGELAVSGREDPVEKSVPNRLGLAVKPDIAGVPADAEESLARLAPERFVFVSSASCSKGGRQ